MRPSGPAPWHSSRTTPAGTIATERRRPATVTI